NDVRLATTLGARQHCAAAIDDVRARKLPTLRLGSEEGHITLRVVDEPLARGIQIFGHRLRFGAQTARRQIDVRAANVGGVLDRALDAQTEPAVDALAEREAKERRNHDHRRERSQAEQRDEAHMQSRARSSSTPRARNAYQAMRENASEARADHDAR